MKRIQSCRPRNDVLPIFSLVLVLAAQFSMGPAVAQEEKGLPAAIELAHSRMLTVAGRGEVFAKPDQAVVRLGAQSQAKEAAAAQKSVNETMQKVLAAVKKLGVPERSIRTSGLNLYPVYQQTRTRNPGDEAEITGYTASNTVQITLDNLDLIGQVIDAGMAAGVNRLEGVTFDLRNDRSQRNEALVAAIHEAKAKAAAMAPALQVKLGTLREVIEGGVSTEPPQPFFGRRAGLMSSEASTPVQPGEVRVEASVTLRYEILPQ